MRQLVRRSLTALTALTVLGAAHAGLYALLTAPSRRDREALLRAEGEAVLTAEDPGRPPAVDDARAWKEFNPKKRLHDERARWEALRDREGSLATWIGVAFAAQAGFVLWLLVRSSTSRN